MFATLKQLKYEIVKNRLYILSAFCPICIAQFSGAIAKNID